MVFSPRRRSHIIAAIAEKGAYKGRIKKHTYELLKFAEYGDAWIDVTKAKPTKISIAWRVCVARHWHDGFAPTVWKALEAVEEAVGI